MGEILFKVKRIDNGEWVYWNIFGELCRESGKRTRLAIQKGATTSYYDYIHQIITLIDKNTICRATGLTDKNGNKIWENDIVTVLERGIEMSGGFISFFNDYPGGWLITNKTMEARCCLCMRNNVEVIGNVFDNADLVKE